MSAAYGPGKYDLIATLARQSSGAKSVILIIENGIFGSGFSVQTEDPFFEIKIPAMLRIMANEIEKANSTPHQ